MRNKPIYCKFNMDTACVDAIFLDGMMISIYCPDVENEIANSCHARYTTGHQNDNLWCKSYGIKTEEFMIKPICCKFNMDTACVDAIFLDGTMISIYCPGVEDEIANSVQQRTELMWLIYNAPEEYVDLVLDET